MLTALYFLRASKERERKKELQIHTLLLVCLQFMQLFGEGDCASDIISPIS